MSDLPKEIRYTIFSLLPTKDLLKASATSKEFKEHSEKAIKLTFGAESKKDFKIRISNLPKIWQFLTFKYKYPLDIIEKKFANASSTNDAIEFLSEVDKKALVAMNLQDTISHLEIFALKVGLITIQHLKEMRPEIRMALLSKSKGIQALEEKLLDDSFVEILNKYGVEFLRENVLTIEDLLLIKNFTHRELFLSNEYGLQLLKEELLTPILICEISDENTLRGILSKDGLRTLRQNPEISIKELESNLIPSFL